MRTKQQEELEHQERTWIYLLHDQAPPTNQRHVTPAVLAARSAGALGDHTPHMPLLPSMSAATPMMYHNNDNNNGPTNLNGPHQYHSQGPYVSAHAPAYSSNHTGYDAYGRPVVQSSASNNGYPASYASNASGYARSGPEFVAKPPTQRALGSVISAHDKWQVQVQVPAHQSAFPPLRSILSKSQEKMSYPSVVVPGPIVMKSQQQLPPVATPSHSKSQIQTQVPVADRRPKQKKSSSDLVDLLPKKRRHEEIDEVYVAPAFGEDGENDDDDDETRLSKRNCFPKKCDFPMCKNSSRSRGFCYSHGGGRRCRMDGCNNGAVSRDLCKRHGGGRRCRINGCKSSSESGGLCYSHGGGRRCSLSWCSARAKKGGFCAVHIGNENAEQPSAEELEALAASSSAPAQQSQPQASESKQAVPPNVVETLLSLASASSASSNNSSRGRAATGSFSLSTGSVSPTSPSLPELSTPRYSSIASLLN